MTWITTKKTIKKKFKFKSFDESIKFLNKIAEISKNRPKMAFFSCFGFNFGRFRSLFNFG